MTAKVASPASPAEDLACRGPLKAKRSLYTEDQLSFTRKVLQTPTKQGHSVVCVSFMRLLMDLPFISTSVRLFTFCFSLICTLFPLTFTKLGAFVVVRALVYAKHMEVYVQRASAEAVFSFIYSLNTLSNPSCLQSRHIRPCLTAPKQEARTLDSLSYYLGHWPAMPLTLCHIAYSHYKP